MIIKSIAASMTLVLLCFFTTSALAAVTSSPGPSSSGDFLQSRLTAQIEASEPSNQHDLMSNLADELTQLILQYLDASSLALSSTVNRSLHQHFLTPGVQIITSEEGQKLDSEMQNLMAGRVNRYNIFDHEFRAAARITNFILKHKFNPAIYGNLASRYSDIVEEAKDSILSEEFAIPHRTVGGEQVSRIKMAIDYAASDGLIFLLMEIHSRHPEVDFNLNYSFSNFPPLQLAAKWGHLDIFEFLLEHGALINGRSMGETALDQALGSKRENIVEYIALHYSADELNNSSFLVGLGYCGGTLSGVIKEFGTEHRLVSLLREKGARTAQELGRSTEGCNIM